MSDAWTRWQGHVVNGTFPLGRYLGGSDHGAVFVTRAATRGSSQVALKLIPAIAQFADSRLADWSTFAGLTHPHLVRLFETGHCQLDGQPYLYALMEYADQTLAQVLSRRALTEDEACEMLLPTLGALGFLHSRNLVQARLKPANMLAVGDQLKLASDTIRRVGEARDGSYQPSVYDPPEARDTGYSTAGDIWALGVSFFEALTRSRLSGLHERRGEVTLPADFSPRFREIVAWCLSRRPYDRPKVSEIDAWVRRTSVVPAPVGTHPPPREQIARATAVPEPKTPPPVIAPTAAPVLEVPVSAAPEASRSEITLGSALRKAVHAVVSQETLAQLRSEWRSYLISIMGAVAILALVWTGEHALKGHPVPTSATGKPPRAAPSQSQTPRETGVSSPSTTSPAQVAAAIQPSAVHEVIPDIPRDARRTIRGHIKVYVRLIVDPDGTVYAALADRPGPSRYFERLSIEAAKKWTFPPVDGEAQRLMQVTFDFTRAETTARVVTLQAGTPHAKERPGAQ